MAAMNDERQGLQDFNGLTWVAFADLCGTKKMYRESPTRAAHALNGFYNAVYGVQLKADHASALAVTDCTVFWVGGPAQLTRRTAISPEVLEGLLRQMKTLHQEMVGSGYLVRTTVAYGHFRYERRIELPQLRKDMIIGGAYMAALAANDRVRPGTILILEPSAQDLDGRPPPGLPECAGILAPFLQKAGAEKWEFVWWVASADHVPSERRRRNQWRKVEGYEALIRTYGGNPRATAQGDNRGR